MATTKELFKERMKIRKTDPVRASVLGMLIDTVQKNIRELNREETEADLAQAAKKMYDQTSATIAEYKKGNADTTQLEAELAVLKEFVPEEDYIDYDNVELLNLMGLNKGVDDSTPLLFYSSPLTQLNILDAGNALFRSI